MVNETFAGGLFKVVRERVLIEHSTPDEKKLLMKLHY